MHHSRGQGINEAPGWVIWIISRCTLAGGLLCLYVWGSKLWAWASNLF